MADKLGTITKRKRKLGNKKLKNIKMYEDIDEPVNEEEHKLRYKLEDLYNMLNVINWLFDAGILDDNGALDPEYDLEDTNEAIKDEFGTENFFTEETLKSMPKMLMDELRKFH
jgi:hypothetical protein